MLPRIIGVFTLNAETFEEIEHDPKAMGQAAIIVGIVALLSALGSGVGASLSSDGTFSGSFFSTFVVVWIGWVLWSGITYLIGTAVFGGKSDMAEMLRVVGFAFAPQILGIVPAIGSCIGAVWSLAALFVAMRQGLDISTGKTIATLLIGFVIYLALTICAGSTFGGVVGLVGG